VEELRQVRADERTFEMGALTTYTGVRRHPLLSRELPMLAQAASETGGIAIQNRGTLGGNIGNASPAADSPPALLAYGAEVVLVSRRGERTVPYATFHTAYKRTVAAPDELVARILVSRGDPGRVHYYRKVGPRRAQAISKVCFAACADRDGARVRDVKIALGGVAPVPVRALEAEQAIVAGEPFERVSEALARAIAPIDDVRSTSAYRRRVADNLLRDFLRHVAHPS
jgi:CO/xanthine dehydrogenase FAD-binding subunit